MTFADGSRRDVQSRELRCPKNAKQVTYKGERGYYHDPNLGSAESTFYLHHRVYGETEGRFKSRDPAEDDPNLYRYVRNNPVNQVDPSGLEKVEVDEDGTVWVYPESWWFGIDYDDSRIKVGQLAEYTTTTVSGQGPGNKYTIIVTPMRRVGIDGESHPIILHYSHFEQFVHSYDFTNIRSVHVGDYIREEGFSVNRTREQVHRSAGFAATQMDQFVRSYTLYAAYAEFTDAVIDEAATRAVTAGVAGGLSVKLLRRGKKAPTRVRGQWQNINEAMSARARAYQQQITGRGGQSFLVDGVKFDGVIDNVLIDAKGPGYSWAVRNGRFRTDINYRGANQLLEQAKRQLGVANGNPIRWHVAEADTATAIRRLFRDNNITGIDIVHTPVVP